MKNLTTPKAILFGFSLVAFSIASLPYSSTVINQAQAELSRQDQRLFKSQFTIIKFAIRDVATELKNVATEIMVVSDKLECANKYGVPNRQSCS